jgi:lipopolysaccharide/colanic/teichoic acid biosynthesis glycosyltransferase
MTPIASTADVLEPRLIPARERATGGCLATTGHTLRTVAPNRTLRGRSHDHLDPPVRTLARIQWQERIAMRSGRAFSLVSFQVGEPEFGRGRTARLLHVLRNRIRKGDEVGWIADGWLAVLLAHANEDGAATFAAEVVATFAARDGDLRFQTYTYPSATQRRDQHVAERQQHHDNRTGDAGSPRAKAPAGNPMPAWKRTMDVAGAGFGLIALAPVMLAVAIWVRLSSRGPVFFRQVRAGMNGVPFVMFKFRTMVDGAEAMQASLQPMNERSGPTFKLRRDPRVTIAGRLLRATSVDELPQLWNVLRGDMSLVGPRPPTLDEVDKYEPWQRGRLSGIPGLTCTWQVCCRASVDFADWVRMDLRYLQQRSLLLDLKLLARTVWTVIRLRGAL